MTTKTDPKDIQIIVDGFQYKGRQYPFTNIAHLRFARMVRSTHMGLPIKITEIGSDESVGLMISLTSGEEIKLTEKPGFFPSKAEKIKDIINIYSKLAEATFKSRLESYIKEAEQRGYFYYSDHRFYLSRKAIASVNQEYTRENTDFFRAYGYIEYKPKHSTITQKMKQKIGVGKPNVIDTLTDTDVIFPILSHFYGFNWG